MNIICAERREEGKKFQKHAWLLIILDFMVNICQKKTFPPVNFFKNRKRFSKMVGTK